MHASSATPPTPIQCACLLTAAALTLELFHLGAQPVAVGLFAAPWDKLAHFACFGAITGLLWIGTAGRMPVVIVLAAIAIGALDELHQGALPGRIADVLDLLVDAVAAVTVACVMLAYESHQKTRL